MSVLVVLAGVSILGSSSCGGGSSPTTPIPSGSSAPAPTSTPTPAPAPSPSASPCTVGLCEDPVTNRNPVARVLLRLYLCFDRNNQVVECPDPFKQVVVQPIPLGWRLKLDVTGRDAEQHETNGVSNGEGIQFIYSDPSMIDENIRSNWQRDIKPVTPGKWEVYVVFDGVASNSLGFTFVP